MQKSTVFVYFQLKKQLKKLNFKKYTYNGIPKQNILNKFDEDLRDIYTTNYKSWESFSKWMDIHNGIIKVAICPDLTVNSTQA